MTVWSAFLLLHTFFGVSIEFLKFLKLSFYAQERGISMILCVFLALLENSFKT